MRARAIALKAHEGQFRRDRETPYFYHPQAVAEMLENESEEIRATAWLHDVIEDTAVNADAIRANGMPEIVVRSVITLTKVDSVPYEAYLSAVKACPIASKVKVADMLCNLADSPTSKQVSKYAAGLAFLLH